MGESRSAMMEVTSVTAAASVALVTGAAPTVTASLSTGSATVTTIAVTAPTKQTAQPHPQVPTRSYQPIKRACRRSTTVTTGSASAWLHCATGRTIVELDLTS